MFRIVDDNNSNIYDLMQNKGVLKKIVTITLKIITNALKLSLKIMFPETSSC